VITTLMRVSRTNLRRDRVAQAMTFLLPIVFFSIFAAIFGRQSFSSTSRIDVAVVDEDRSPASTALVAALNADPGLRVRDSTAARAGALPQPLDRAGAEHLVRAGEMPVAIIVPVGFGATFPSFTGQGTKVDLLADVSDPVASYLTTAMLQRSGAKVLRARSPAGAGAGAETALVPTHVVELMAERKQGRRMVSFYAAGIAVMFLLFSVSSAGGSLLDEQDSGTLERVLNTNVGMGGLLAGKWLHLVTLGLVQITVMFTWGTLVFHLDLLDHLPGFIVMTIATAAAAGAFGLVLASACRTRQQLSGISTIVILVMSSLGGSMFPRFLMSPGMQKLGLVTFNAWALDGYIKVFWRQAPVWALWPQVAVLLALTAMFLTVARLFARRWEAV